MRLKSIFLKYERRLQYLAFIATSLAIGSIMAGLNADFTRALATWLTMSFAAIGLHIAINKYGFDLDEKSKKNLRYISSIEKKVSFKNSNNQQETVKAIIQEFKNDSDVHARIKIPINFDATILYKINKDSATYRILWDGQNKNLVQQDPEIPLVKSGETIMLTFIKNSALQPTLEYYYDDNIDNIQYLTLYLVG